MHLFFSHATVRFSIRVFILVKKLAQLYSKGIKWGFG